MEFELDINLLLFHTNADTDVHAQLESLRIRTSSEAELCQKEKKIVCTATRKDVVSTQSQHRSDVIFGARIQPNLQTRWR